MNVGFIGLGKLGLPVALAMESKWHKIFGFDRSKAVQETITERLIPYQEPQAQELLEKSNLKICGTYEEIGKIADIIFIAVQTPHAELFEGITPMPDYRQDFDYSWLTNAVSAVCGYLAKPTPVCIISTVLPGTMHREIAPIIASNPNFRLCYNPYFIAMGTVIDDFLNPEFVLLGCEDAWARGKIIEFYRTIHNKTIQATSIENAELAKVLYNTFISLKIVFANTVMELCHHIPGTNCDAITGILSQATDRLISPSYLWGGMGDGGACHPRDNIALSWLSRKHGLSFDLFEAIMRAREAQTRWLADLAITESRRTSMRIVLLGRAFKADSNIQTGSPARLLEYYIKQAGHECRILDPYFGGSLNTEKVPAVYVISTRHSCWGNMVLPEGSRVIDPWRKYYFPKCVNIPVGAPPV